MCLTYADADTDADADAAEGALRWAARYTPHRAAPRYG